MTFAVLTHPIHLSWWEALITLAVLALLATVVVREWRR